MKNLFRSAAAGTVIALAACSGHGGTLPASPAQTQPQSRSAQVQFSIRIPQGRKAQYVSGATTNAQIVVNPQSANPVSTTIKCSAGACSGSVEAPIGDDTFAVNLVDMNGKVLSKGQVASTIAAGKANNVDITFGGVVAQVDILIPQGTLTPGTATSIAVNIVAKDAASYVIVGTENYDSPITLTDTDNSNTTSLSTTQVTSPATQVELAYNGGAGFTGAQISASVAGASIVSTPAGVTTSGGGTVTGLSGYREASLPIPDGSDYTGYPWHGMSSGPDGRLWITYAAGSGSHALYAVDPKTAAVQIYAVPDTTYLTQLTSDATHLYAMDAAGFNSIAVDVFDASGNLVKQLPDSNNVTGLNKPENFLVGDDGNIYLYSNAYLYELNPSSGTWTAFTAPNSCIGVQGGWSKGSDGNLWAVCDQTDVVSFSIGAHTFAISSVQGQGTTYLPSNGAHLALGSDGNFYLLDSMVDSNYVGHGSIGTIPGSGGAVSSTQLPNYLAYPLLVPSAQGKIAMLTQDANKNNADVLMFFDESTHGFSGEYLVSNAPNFYGGFNTSLFDKTGSITGIAFLEDAHTLGIYMP